MYFLLGDLYLSHVAHHVFHSKQTFCAACVSAHSACLNKRRTQLHLLTNLVSLYTRSAAYCLISPDTSRTESLLALAAVDLAVSQCSAEEVQGRRMPFHLSKKLQFLLAQIYLKILLKTGLKSNFSSVQMRKSSSFILLRLFSKHSSTGTQTLLPFLTLLSFQAMKSRRRPIAQASIHFDPAARSAAQRHPRTKSSPRSFFNKLHTPTFSSSSPPKDQLAMPH